MRQMPSQYEYYHTNNFLPSIAHLKNYEDFKKYANIRVNLYQRHLGIPVSLLSNQKVLEVGCGTGDNALVFASAGCRMTLLDADENIWESLFANFKRFGLDDQIEGTHCTNVSDFNPEVSYNLIMAEGFLFTCEDRNEILLKLVDKLVPGGFISVSYPDTIGSFMEFLKKAAFIKGLILNDIENPLSKNAIEFGRTLFGDAHSTLHNPRSFETWLIDCIASPFLQADMCWTAESIIRKLLPKNMIYYSSSPSIHEIDILSWYKDVSSTDQWNEAALIGHSARSASFVFGEKVTFPSEESATTFKSETVRFVERLSAWFTEPEKDLQAPKKHWFKSLEQTKIAPALIEDLKVFFEALNSSSKDHYDMHITMSKKILSCWGKSYHYLVMQAC